jgi:hypothetical protein
VIRCDAMQTCFFNAGECERGDAPPAVSTEKTDQSLSLNIIEQEVPLDSVGWRRRSSRRSRPHGSRQSRTVTHHAMVKGAIVVTTVAAMAAVVDSSDLLGDEEGIPWRSLVFL